MIKMKPGEWCTVFQSLSSWNQLHFFVRTHPFYETPILKCIILNLEVMDRQQNRVEWGHANDRLEWVGIWDSGKPLLAFAHCFAKKLYTWSAALHTCYHPHISSLPSWVIETYFDVCFFILCLLTVCKKKNRGREWTKWLISWSS